MLGEHKSTLDSKNRMNIPAKLREEIGNVFILSKNIGERCIKVYSLDGWREMMKKLDEKPAIQTQKLRRFLCGTAYEVTADKQGRVSIQPSLIEYAGLTTDVVVVGTDGGAEIWNKASWEKYISDTDGNDDLFALAVEFGM